MIRALYTAASGMNAQQTNIDNTAHNLANVNTTGFKKARVEFEDLVYQQVRGAGAPNSTRAFLKPVVLTLARLCAVLSMLVCCAFIPLAAV